MTDLAFAARHTCDSAEWYTPVPYVEAARQVLCGIDLDPASHAEAQLTVRAQRYYDAAHDGLARAWDGRVFLNPPGGLVRQFWGHLVAHVLTGRVPAAIWIGYSLEQLQTLQAGWTGVPPLDYPVSPIDYPICIPRARIAFKENDAKKAERVARLVAAGKSPYQKSSPSHANYISLLTTSQSDVCVDRFLDVFQAFGVTRILGTTRT